MTRIEISICHPAIRKFRPDLPSHKTLWHYKLQNALSVLIKEVLNHESVIKRVYHKVSLPKLMSFLGLCNYNILVIGQRNTWMINARTSHKRHFIGTRYCIGLSNKRRLKDTWSRLHDFVLKYACRGATIKVFCLN